MIKHVICVAVATSLYGVAIGQQRLTVQIVDKTNQKKIENATVQLTGAREAQQRTNSNGVAQFPNLENGTYQVQISYVGYRTYHTFLSVNKDETLTVSLEPSTIRTEEALVYSTRAKENAPTSYTNIGKTEIARNNLGQDIPYLLDQTPSVVIGSDAGAGIGYTNMTIRGSDNQRINVTLNGIPLNDAESMGSFFINLPDFASSTESIQIQRGIGTSTNGAGSFGASLNVQSNTLEREPYAELNNSYGSYNSWKNTLKIGTGLLKNKFAFNARLSRILSDGYIQKASSDLKSFYIDGGYYGDKQILKAIVFSGKEKTYQAWYGVPEPLIKGDRASLSSYADAMEIYDPAERVRLENARRDYNIYTYDNQTDNYTQTHHQLHYSNFINDKLTFNAALHYTRGYGYYEEFRPEDKLANYNLPPVTFNKDTVSTSDLVRRRWLDNYFYGATTSLSYNPNEALKLTFGSAWNQYKGDHYGEVIWARYASTGNLGDHYYDGEARKNDFSAFAKADYQVGNWLLMADVQYRNIDYLMEGNDDKIKNYHFHPTFNFVNPKVGFTYLIDEQSNVYASYAYASKEPVRKDFVENTATADPKAEKMQDIEAGYRLRTSAVNVGINGYAMLYKDQLISTGAINDVGSTIRQNVPDSYRIGVEFDGAWQIAPQFLWKATAGLSQNKIKNFVEYGTIYDNDWNVVGTEEITYDKTNITMSPSVILSNEFAYSPVRSFTLALASKYVSRQYLDNSSAEERSIDPYFVNNLKAIYSFSALGLEKVDLNLSVNNIFNTKYETNGYTWGSFDTSHNRYYYNFYFPQAPTNFMLGLNIRL